MWGEEARVGAEQSTRGAPKPEIINQIDNLICVYSLRNCRKMIS